MQKPPIEQFLTLPKEILSKAKEQIDRKRREATDLVQTVTRMATRVNQSQKSLQDALARIAKRQKESNP